MSANSGAIAKLGRRELLQYVNEFLESDYEKIESFRDGCAFAQILDACFPGVRIFLRRHLRFASLTAQVLASSLRNFHSVASTLRPRTTTSAFATTRPSIKPFARSRFKRRFPFRNSPQVSVKCRYQSNTCIAISHPWPSQASSKRIWSSCNGFYS